MGEVSSMNYQLGDNCFNVIYFAAALVGIKGLIKKPVIVKEYANKVLIQVGSLQKDLAQNHQKFDHLCFMHIRGCL